MTPSSAQYSCPAVTHSLLSPHFFFFCLPSLMHTTFSHAQRGGFPSLVWKKSSFWSIFPLNILPLSAPLDERPSPRLTHAHVGTRSCITYQRLNDWLTVYDWSIFSPLVAAPSSSTGRFVHSSFIPLPLLYPFFFSLFTLYPFLSF